MKNYIKPEFEIVKLDNTDVICTSTLVDGGTSNTPTIGGEIEWPVSSTPMMD